MSIDDELTARFRAACQESRALGYAPVRMEQMLSGTGAVKAAKRLVASADLQSGLKELAKLERLDLSLESIMLEPQFRGAFTDQGSPPLSGAWIRREPGSGRPGAMPLLARASAMPRRHRARLDSRGITE